MNLNWERLSLSAYFESLEAHNASQGGNASGGGHIDTERMERFNKAHGVG